MDREQMLRVLGEVYAARVKGDVDGVLKMFTDDAKFNLNASPQQTEVSVATDGASPLHAVMTKLVTTFEFKDLEIVDSIVEGSRAAIRIRFTARSRANGKEAKTESLDLVEFRDGKVSSYTQFFDTATAHGLITPTATEYSKAG